MGTTGPRHLISLAGLDDASFDALLARADALAGSVPPPRSLEGLTVANLFYEPSTRTRASFELAARRLGAAVLNLDVAKSSAVKGESLADTVRTLHAMGTGLFVVYNDTRGLGLALPGTGRSLIVKFSRMIDVLR
jgi:aspartate carbamoyltransferase catalytic subunit